MASFESKIHRLTIEPHPNADRLELAAVGGYRSVVLKGAYRTGDLGAYIPEGAICPDWLIAFLGLEGRLAGSKMNRVKAIRLRGVLSQGLVYPVTDGKVLGWAVDEGDDVTDLLEVVKYVPPIPIHMQGEVEPAFGMTIRYDIEDVKNYPDVLEAGEPVVMTEKLHGTWCCLGWHPDFGPVVTSKGMSSKGLVFTLDDANENNLYVQAWEAHRARLREMFSFDRECAGAFYVLGELHGAGVQGDLRYGLDSPELRIFDIYIGEPGREEHGSYVDPGELRRLAETGGLAVVPEVYAGPYSDETMLEHTEGPTTLDAPHVREGVVIRPLRERRVPDLGRVILKSRSGDYLTRHRK